MRLAEILARKQEIRSALEANQEVDLEAVQAELAGLDLEERNIQTKIEIAGKINTGELRGNLIQTPQKQAFAQGEDLEYRNAFMDYVLRGKEIPQELRANANTKTSDIGSVVPNTVLNKIIEKIESTGMILPLVTRTAYKGGLSIPISSVKPVATWVAEGATSDRQKKTTGSITFNYFKLRCSVSVSLETDTVALSAFEATLISTVTEAMVKAIEQAIINGTGVGSPKGILAETAVAGQAITATPVYAKLIEAESALPLAYENSAVYCMTKKSFMAFFAEVDTNKQPIARVNNGINGKIERTLLGRNVVLCDYISTYATGLTAGTPWAFLFNFSDYILNTNYNMGLKKFEDNDTDDQVTKAIMLVDGKVVDLNSLVTLIR
jgi:HK97 family phage major capsid protein